MGAGITTTPGLLARVFRSLAVTLALVACSPSEEEVEAELAEFIASRDDCTVDEDCALAHTECPLGCYHAVNKAHVTAVEDKARELVDDYESGGMGCTYRCARAFGAMCQAGTCAVSTAERDGGPLP